ncbi:MlaD family protein [Selenomonas sputigena]|uniref:MlaD family protein n=1 Tax=Selenomonas sputigena TaxID=69823 RepID=A0ABV3X3I0_9FIRM
MTTEAKVGAFTLLGIGMLAAILMHLGGFSFSGNRDYTIYVGFSQVVGLSPDSDVRYAGVAAGKVKAIEPEGMGVRVTLSIKPEIQIPQDARFSLSANSVLGDKFVLISPAGSRSTEYLKDGDFVLGTDETNMDNVLASVNEAVKGVQVLLTSLNEILGSPRMKESVLGSAENVREVTAHIREVTAVLGRVALNNEGNLHAMVQQMQTILANLAATTETVRQMANDVNDDGQTAANLRLTLLNVSKASENIRKVAEEIHEVTGDPEVRDNLKTTIRQAREVTQKANDTLDKFRGIKADPSLDVLYSGKDENWITNVNVDISKETAPDRFLRVGLEDIGEGNDLNLEVGRRNGGFGARAGIIAGEAGIGLDAYGGDRWVFSADGYDPNDFRLRLSALYRLNGNTSLMGQWRDVNKRDRRAAYFGLHHAF